jgi:hypothetical protein
MQLFGLFTPVTLIFTVLTAIKYCTIEIFCISHTIDHLQAGELDARVSRRDVAGIL